MDKIHLKITAMMQEIIKIGKIIYDKGYNAGKDGNISVRIDSEHILITTSGALLGFLTNEDFVLTDKFGNVIQNFNDQQPSSELVMHIGIYRERNDINAVIHAHAPYCISLSMLDIDTENNLYAVSAGPVPITEIALPSTSESWNKIEPFIKTRSKAILRRHGLVAWGKDLTTAFVKLEETEHFAKTLVNALAVKNINPIGDETKNKLLTIWKIK